MIHVTRTTEELFVNEAMLVAKLRHPNVVNLLGIVLGARRHAWRSALGQGAAYRWAARYYKLICRRWAARYYKLICHRWAARYYN